MPVLAKTGGKISSSGGLSKTDRKASRASRPVIIPNVYSGDSCCKEWINHFESLALVNGWHNPSKLLWWAGRLVDGFSVAQGETDKGGTDCVEEAPQGGKSYL